MRKLIARLVGFSMFVLALVMNVGAGSRVVPSWN